MPETRKAFRGLVRTTGKYAGASVIPHHSDHGSNYMAMLYSDQIAELGAIPSTGIVHDSFSNAMVTQ